MSALNDIAAYLLQTALNLALLAMLLRFLLQVVRADFYNPLSQFLARITNPLVLPLRRVIPSVGGLDLSTWLI
ncbi:MAG: YggT family protein, partial [Haliea sp.]|nr:YggT family protein [Haliea sp.]